MRPQFGGSVLLNNPIAANVDTATMPGFLILPGKSVEPILLSGITEILTDVAAAEVRQVITVTLPTIVANTSYGIRAGSSQTEIEVSKIGIRGYNGSVASLISAGVDQLKVGEQIARALRGFFKNYVEAGMRVTLTHANTGDFVLGEVIRGATSGASGIVRNLNGATTTTTVDIIEGVFADNEVLTGDTSGVSQTGAVTIITTNDGTLVITDKAGYHPSTGSRSGALQVYAGRNILPSAIVETTSAVLSFGQGTRMLLDVPVFEVHSDNLAKGLWDFPTDEAPIAGREYSRAIILFEKNVSTSAAIPTMDSAIFAAAVWYDDADGTSGNTAAFEAALAAVV